MQKKWAMSRNYFLIIAFSLYLAGCTGPGIFSAYYVDIHQGNLFTQEQIEEIQPGMTQRQVRFILGSPMVADTFNPDRWDYLYTITHRDQLNIEQHLAIFFKEGVVDKVEKYNVKEDS